MERNRHVHGLVLCAGVTHNIALIVSVTHFGGIEIANRLRPLIEAATGSAYPISRTLWAGIT